jgi:hypothetical protein
MNTNTLRRQALKRFWRTIDRLYDLWVWGRRR